MKPDEREFLTAVQRKDTNMTVREVVSHLAINHKRAWFLLEKWARNGWYEWGAVIDMGWLTDAGRQA